MTLDVSSTIDDVILLSTSNITINITIPMLYFHFSKQSTFNVVTQRWDSVITMPAWIPGVDRSNLREKLALLIWVTVSMYLIIVYGKLVTIPMVEIISAFVNSQCTFVVMNILVSHV